MIFIIINKCAKGETVKIYWTKKSIPELRDLPEPIRDRNYKEARSKASAHYEHWLGALLFFALIFIFFSLFNTLFPGENALWRDIAQCVLCIPPAVMAWDQCTIYVMRKYYRHVLINKDLG